MPESPTQAVTDETQDEVVVKFAWKPLAKKVAGYTAAALVGAGLYALVTRPIPEDVSDESTPELDAE